MDNTEGNCTIYKQNKNTTIQTNTDKVNKIRALLQETGGQDEQNIVEIIYQSCYSMRWLFLVLNDNVVVSGILVAQSLVYVYCIVDHY